MGNAFSVISSHTVISYDEDQQYFSFGFVHLEMLKFKGQKIFKTKYLKLEWNSIVL